MKAISLTPLGRIKMLKHFYRLMVVALGFFVASSCGEATPKYGNIYTDYDDGTLDEEVVDEDAVDNDVADMDERYDNPVPEYAAPDVDFEHDAPNDDGGGLDSEAEFPDEGIDHDGYADDTLYGCPYVEYRVEGTVTGVAGSPVEGIEVEMTVEYYYPISTKTDAAGEFTLDQTTDQLCDELSSLKVEARDVDGAVNGKYQQKTLMVPLVCTYESERQCTNTEVKMELEEVSSDDDTLLND